MAEQGAADHDLAETLLSGNESEHLLLFYYPGSDRLAVFLPFLREGIARRERCLLIAGDELIASLRARLAAGDLPAEEIDVLDAADWYLEGGQFDPERMLRRWRACVADALARGYTGIRVVGDVESILARIPDLEAFVAYEQRVQQMIASIPMRAVCAYDLSALQEPYRTRLVGHHQTFAQAVLAEELRLLETAFPLLQTQTPTTLSARYGDLEVRFLRARIGSYFVVGAQGGDDRVLPPLAGPSQRALLEATLRNAQTQEELRQRNALLEAQNEQLRAQAEEIRARNDELAAQRRELETRNAALELANQELELARAQAAAIIAASADGIMLVDGEQRIVAVNPALERLAGFSAPEMEGRTCTHMLDVHQDDGTLFCDTVCPLLHPEQARPRTIDARLMTKEGQEVWVNVAYGPIRDATGRVAAVVHTIRDINERKELELAKDEFFTVVNHEIKGPLTSAKGYAQLLLRQMLRSQADAAAEALRVIDRQLSRIAELVDRLLDASRAQLRRLELHPELMDLAAVVRQVVEQVQVTTQRHVLVARVEGSIEGVWDRARLEQVLSNLVDNAVRYSPQGGEIVAGARREGDRAIAWVRDHGIGISPDAQRRVFQPYYRARAAQLLVAEGLGLGLYISHQIVVAHGGQIWVESEEGQGSTFTFSLPDARQPSSP